MQAAAPVSTGAGAAASGCSCQCCGAAFGPLTPGLKAVVANTPQAFTTTATHGPFTASPCQLAPLHLAAALGRDACVKALLESGASPFVWTRPPGPPSSNSSEEGGADAGAGGVGEDEQETDGYSSYEGVCCSVVYQSLKQLLPSSAEFPYTFTLAQLLLRTPCSPLLLAVRFGKQTTAATLLEAMERCASCGNMSTSSSIAGSGSGSSCLSSSSTCTSVNANSGNDSGVTSEASTSDLAGNTGDSSTSSTSRTTSGARDSLSLHLDAALAYWPVASEPHVDLLRRLLAAGSCSGRGASSGTSRSRCDAQPLRRLLPAVLSRYNNCNPQSGMADKLREGLREVLRHVLPLPDGAPSEPDGQHSPEMGGGEAGASAGSIAWREGLEPPSAPVLWQLLTAAVVCRDEQRSTQLLAAMDAGSPDPWADGTANCTLLCTAAAHDMAGVVERLLARPPPPPGHGPPPFNANMWGPDGLSVLMAAAHRGSLAALQALLAAGATVNLADEMGSTALHWGVVGDNQEAIMLLAQHGAAVDQAGVVHEEEEHLEKPMLTAVARNNLAMIRLLAGLGASLDEPASSGSTPLSVAVCWEQQEAAKLLLQLGADPNQVLPSHVNGGCYPMWSDSYSAEEAHTVLGMACSRMDHRDHLAMLLEAGADPTLCHPKTGLTPAAEACSIGALEEAALLIELTAEPAGPWTLEELGWVQAVAEAVSGIHKKSVWAQAGNFYWHHSSYPEAALEPLLDAWRRQPSPPPAPPPHACTAIVSGLLAHPALQVAEGAHTLQAGAELAGVMQAERMASVGIAADLTSRLPTSSCGYVVLAAAPAATRWSQSNHHYFPPAFKQAVRQLLLVNHRLSIESRLISQRHNHSSGHSRSASHRGSGACRNSHRGGTGGAPAQLSAFDMNKALESPELESASVAGIACVTNGKGGISGEPAGSEVRDAEGQQLLVAPNNSGSGLDLGDRKKAAAAVAEHSPIVRDGEEGVDKAAAPASAGGGGDGFDAATVTPSTPSTPSTLADRLSARVRGESPIHLDSRILAVPLDRPADSGQAGEADTRGSLSSLFGSTGAGSSAASPTPAPATPPGCAAAAACEEVVGSTIRGLPKDALLEVVRHLGAVPLSFWLRPKQDQPATDTRAARLQQQQPQPPIA